MSNSLESAGFTTSRPDAGRPDVGGRRSVNGVVAGALGIFGKGLNALMRPYGSLSSPQASFHDSGKFLVNCEDGVWETAAVVVALLHSFNRPERRRCFRLMRGFAWPSGVPLDSFNPARMADKLPGRLYELLPMTAARWLLSVECGLEPDRGLNLREALGFCKEGVVVIRMTYGDLSNNHHFRVDECVSI